MHISKIELENIKSHASSTFEFTRGTTAITGANGAGKTTIIEAVAWALFDLLEYKKEDFVRRGEKRGVVRITFESGLDEREYVVYRDTGTGYYVLDPRLDTRIAEKKEEVFRFLWQHLGLEPGTDLRSLFRQAIGVPQGTFTAIFLEGATERKVAFDRLLKVEEYRQAAEKLRPTSRHLDGEVITLRESLARAEGELARSDAVEEELRTQRAQAEQLDRQIADLDRLIREKRVVVEKLDEAVKIENAIKTIKSDRLRAVEALEVIQKAHSEMALLKPKIKEQDALEKEIEKLREGLANARALANQIQGLDERIGRLRELYRETSDQISETGEKAKGAGEVRALEERESGLIRQIAGLRADLERDERFQSEVKNGLCPILSEKCLNLKDGQTLESFISSQFSELRKQITALEADHVKVTAQLAASREAELSATRLAALKEREAELKNEGVRLADERKGLEANASDLKALKETFDSVGSKLNALGDPRSRYRYLEHEIAKEPDLRRHITDIESSLERLESDRQLVLEELEIDGVDLSKGVDNEVHSEIRAALIGLEKEHSASAATLEVVRDREVQLAAEIERLAAVKKTMQGELREKERLESVAEATAFIRDTLKEAAPRVARNYVYHVSLEANLMFREITGNAERTLKWADDYSIVLEELGFERPFASLSGGEQMAAALSVRLALLKQLTDIRIAFFDEPTTNMDAERRENLALQISRITHFDQLFVISHDDTFEGYVDHVLTIGE